MRHILAPCNNRNYGTFYTIVILVLAITLGSLWVLYKVGCYAFKGIKALHKTQSKKQVVKQAAVQAKCTVQHKLSLYGKLEYAILKNNNVLYYTIKSYSNKDGLLRMYVDFTVPVDNNLWDVNRVLSDYLADTGYLLRINMSKKYKGCAILTDVEQIELEQSLAKRYGCQVRLMQLL